METPGSTFLHERNPKLHASDEVEVVVGYLRQVRESIPNEPADKIAAYLGFLANNVNDGILTGDRDSIERQVEAASIALTRENAEAYVKFQLGVARELGRAGDISPDRLDDDMKMTALRNIRRDQQLQLSDWVNELNSTENKYPDWFKYWTFNNVMRYTEFNEELGKNGRPRGFEKRSSSSFGLFPALDRESVSLVYDALVEKLGGQPMGFEYNEMRSLLARANFGELYDEAQNHGFKITDDLKAIKTGGWHNFVQSDHADGGKALSALVGSYRTGWCTAGLETASTQLRAGDFYVWCSTNPATSENEVPRIAVRMENGIVAEVRGIVGGRRQELEPGLEDIVMNKIKDLPGGDTYFKKAEDMKRLTAIEKKTLANRETKLTADELRFLYEIDHDIQGFGYGDDPRIGEIRLLRGDRDKPELARILPESIREQLVSAFAAYKTVAKQLGVGGKRRLFRGGETALTPNKLEELFASKDGEWRANGVYDYIVEKLITDGARFNLVATPNVEASEAQIVALAESFGKNQPYATRVYYELYRKGHYSGRERSGNSGDTPVRLSLIPSRRDGEISGKPVETQVHLLRERQANRPELHSRVPSLLDAVTYWYTLRAQGDKLDASRAFDKTYIRHFDLEPKTTVGRWPIVPRSYVHSDGGPRLYDSPAENESDARLAVG
jgi:hypothetical protein